MPEKTQVQIILQELIETEGFKGMMHMTIQEQIKEYFSGRVKLALPLMALSAGLIVYSFISLKTTVDALSRVTVSLEKTVSSLGTSLKFMNGNISQNSRQINILRQQNERHK